MPLAYIVFFPRVNITVSFSLQSQQAFHALNWAFTAPLAPSTVHMEELSLFLLPSRQWADCGESLCSSNDLWLLQAESRQETPAAAVYRRNSGEFWKVEKKWSEFAKKGNICSCLAGKRFYLNQNHGGITIFAELINIKWLIAFLHFRWWANCCSSPNRFMVLSFCVHFILLLPLTLSAAYSVVQSNLGALFRPVLPLPHIREVEPPFPSLKQPLSPLTEPEAKPEALPTNTTTSVTTALTATTNTTSVYREIMWETLYFGYRTSHGFSWDLKGF